MVELLQLWNEFFKVFFFYCFWAYWDWLTYFLVWKEGGREHWPGPTTNKGVFFKV